MHLKLMSDFNRRRKFQDCKRSTPFITVVGNVALEERWDKKRINGIVCPICFMGNHTSLFKMADEVRVEERIGEEAGAEKAKRKSIRKTAGWNSFYQSVAVSICYLL